MTEIEAKVKTNIQLPTGYFIQYVGQFEAEERASKNILVFSAIAFVAITVLTIIIGSLWQTAAVVKGKASGQYQVKIIATVGSEQADGRFNFDRS